MLFRSADALRQAIGQRGRAVLAVSGGRSPLAFFHALRRISLPWAKVTVTLVDDRQVAPDHPASNEGWIRKQLVQEQAAVASFLGLVGAHDSTWPQTPADWNERARLASRALIDLGPADVVILGMGTDGHFASIFPQATERAAALDPDQPQACLAMHLHPLPPEAPHHRLTQTLSHLRRAHQWFLPLSGLAKAEVLRRSCTPAGRQIPVAALMNPPHPPLKLWISP